MTDTTATDLASWLLEQIAEDERRAKAMATEYPTPWDVADRGWMARVVADGPHFHEVIRVEQHQVSETAWLTDVIQHVETWNPARVLAECEAKRQIIEQAAEATGLDMQVDSDRRVGRRDESTEPYVGDVILRALALPYADRPGYRPEWRPA